MMYWLVYSSLILVSVAILTGILALGVWILSDDRNNPFHEYGVRATWIKCGGLVVAMNILAFGALFVLAATGSVFVVAVGGAIGSVVCYLGGIMVLFEKTIGQAFQLSIACWFLEWGLGESIPFVLNSLGFTG